MRDTPPRINLHRLLTREQIRQLSERSTWRGVWMIAHCWGVARTTRAGFVARAFLAPYWVNYHGEHHLLLYVPCYRLKAMQKLSGNTA